ncbi:hypothetical protein EVAR_4054_1 [Eumeta japonica]|uniref:Uncharacterized protein n=1 Tax=Eumeta variegata TaxID=151549 RepID=A0A4C1T4T4_EUMVA|nr:hypothetical protein EVAR_4054_1 [Eumeta japonica]
MTSEHATATKETNAAEPRCGRFETDFKHGRSGMSRDGSPGFGRTSDTAGGGGAGVARSRVNALLEIRQRSPLLSRNCPNGREFVSDDGGFGILICRFNRR